MIKCFFVAFLLVVIFSLLIEFARFIQLRTKSGQVEDLFKREEIEKIVDEAQEACEEFKEDIQDELDEIYEEFVELKEDLEEIFKPEPVVFINESGSSKKYHSSKTAHNMEKSKMVKLSEAEEAGYTPCAKCFKK